MKTMNTKERIIDEALNLFSINGYKGTSVKNIADAVGIKDSSLYKHFKSKKEILDTIVIMMRQRIGQMSDYFGLPSDDDYKKAALAYSKFDEKSLIDISKKVFLFYLKDPFVSKFWRMGIMEQFNNADVYDLFSKIFLEDSITYLTELFKEMSKQNVVIRIDPEVMAMNFYTPIYFLLSKYTNMIEKEDEALLILEKQVHEFCRVYCKYESI